MTVWINEFHYDNTGTDVGEFVEVAGLAGTDMTGWSLVLYNGNGGAPYNTLALSGVIADQQNGFGTLAFTYPSNGIQNGSPDGIALADGTTLVQFLSYEGSFVGVGGVADGVTSTDIGVAQAGTEPEGTSSLHLVGSGTAYADFTWTATTADRSTGAVNAGQSFSGTDAVVSVSGGSVTEGDAGTTTLTFTVTRSNTTGAFTVDYATADGTATAGQDYTAATGTLTFAAGGPATQEVSVSVSGDTLPEPDETFILALSNLVETSGGASLGTASATGIILNDDIVLTPISAIQGAGHKSPFVGGAVGAFGNSGDVRVTAEGVVTAITTNGFWMQDAVGDGDDATSEGIFVFTSAAPADTITLGETVRVTARVDEFRPGGSSGGNNLTITQLNASTSGSSITELGGNTTITPVLLGVDRVIPTGAIDSDGFAVFNPAVDAVDFWESLEGMLVELPQSRALSPTSNFRTRDPADPSNLVGPPNQEIWVAVESNIDASSETPRGGLILGQADGNPERIQIDDLLPAVDLPQVKVGDIIGPVTGVVNYDFANYEVLVSTPPSVTDGGLTPQTSTLTATPRQVLVASYNVLNLDPKLESTAVGAVAGSDLYTRLGNSDDDVGNGRYAAQAAQIAINLGAPGIVALQEVQDNDGAEISDDVDSALTLQTLVDFIFDNHGVQYAFAYANPPTSNVDGGQPNANIRPAFLYRPDQVQLLGVTRIEDPDPGAADAFPGDDFAASRKPLLGEFSVNGVTVTVINNHLNSKGGDQGLFGNAQPPVLSSEVQRNAQAEILRDIVADRLAADPDARVLVVGDFNDFGWSPPVQTLLAGGLFNLADELLPVNARYTFNFQGNSQALDHILATASLLDDAEAAFEVVHVNSEFSGAASDHDPLLARFDLSEFGERLVGTTGNDMIDGLGGDDTLIGGAGDDTLDGGEGNDRLVGGQGADTLIGGEGVDTAVYGGTVGVTVNLALGTGRGGHAEGDNLSGIENVTGTTGNDTLIGDDGDNRLTGGAGNDTLEGGDGNDRLNGGLGADILDGGEGIDTVVYGGVVGVTVNLALGTGSGGEAEGDTLISIENVIGSLGDDVLTGDAGSNRLLGNAGNDILAGGGGNDTLIGGAGDDIYVFRFADAPGVARVVGFNQDGDDQVRLEGFEGFDALAALEQRGESVVLDLAPDMRIVFVDTLRSDFAASDFLFA